jgi:hypothetical protein
MVFMPIKFGWRNTSLQVRGHLDQFPIKKIYRNLYNLLDWVVYLEFATKGHIIISAVFYSSIESLDFLSLLCANISPGHEELAFRGVNQGKASAIGNS